MWELQQRRHRLGYGTLLPPWVQQDAPMEPMRFSGERSSQTVQQKDGEDGTVYMQSSLPPQVATTIVSRHVPYMTQYPLPPPAPLYNPVVRNRGVQLCFSMRPAGMTLPYVGQANGYLTDDLDEMFRRQQFPYAQEIGMERRPHEPWESTAVVKRARKVRSWKSPTSGCC